MNTIEQDGTCLFGLILILGVLSIFLLTWDSIFSKKEERNIEFFEGNATVQLKDKDGGRYDQARIRIENTGDWSLKIDYSNSDDETITYHTDSNQTFFHDLNDKDIDAVSMTWNGKKEQYLV